MTDRARYDFLTSEIRRLRTDCDGHFYDIGLHLLEMSRLYPVGGFTTLDEYIAEAVELENRQAYKTMRVARNFSRDLAARFGITKCEAWLRYIDATPEADTPLDILRATIDGVPAADATAAQIDAATRELRVPIEWPVEVKALYERIAAVPGVQVKVSDPTGKPKVNLTIPMSSLCDGLKAVTTKLNCT